MKNRLAFAGIVLVISVASYNLKSQDSTYGFNKYENMRFERISQEEGLVNDIVYFINQDSRGFIWIGTNNGLHRYNGYEMKYFTAKPFDSNSLYFKEVRSFLEDHSGNIWLGYTLFGGLSKFDLESERFTHFLHDPDDPESLARGNVFSILQDRAGEIWVGTYPFDKKGGGLNRYIPETTDEPGRFVRYQHDPEDSTSISSNLIVCMMEDRNGDLWIGTFDGLNKFVPGEGNSPDRFIRIPHNPQDERSIPINQIRSLCLDKKGNIWIGTPGDGLVKYIPGGSEGRDRFIQFKNDPQDPGSISDNYIISIYLDSSGNLLIGTQVGGINILRAGRDQSTGRFIRYQYDPDDPESLSDSSIYNIMEDESGILWIATSHGGVNKYDPWKKKFKPYEQDEWIDAILEDRQGELWLGTHTRGLRNYDRETGSYIEYRADPNDPSSLSHDVVWCILEDDRGCLWIGTGNGLNKIIRNSSNPSELQFESFYPQPKDPRVSNTIEYRHRESTDTVWVGTMGRGLYPKGSNSIVCLHKDSTNTIWVGTMGGGLYKFNTGLEQFKSFNRENGFPDGILSDAWVGSIKKDNDGIYWFGTIGQGMYRYDPEADVFTSFRYDPGNTFGISSDYISLGPIDQLGNIWLGPGNSGLTKMVPRGTFGQPVLKNYYYLGYGFPDNTLTGILEDDQGYIWCSSAMGLTRFDPATESCVNYTVEDGLQDYNFTLNATFKSKSGELFFGGIKGFNAFKSVQTNSYAPPVQLEEFRLFNVPVSIHDEASPLKKSIFFEDRIELKHNQNFISFKFAALSYTNTARNQYKYRMIGLDPDTVFAGTDRIADYPAMKHGKYTFWVSGSNDDGIWNEEGRSIDIVIHPPPWQSWYAYLVYGILFAGMLLWYRRYLQNRSRLRMAVEVEKLEKEKIREMDNMRSRFFANISHEFRTPLTLIQGPLDEMAKVRSGTVTLTRDLLEIMRRNTARLNRLINQLLDISKLETGNIRLQVTEGNLEAFIKTILLSFLSLAESRNTRYTWDLPETYLRVYFDSDKLEKILTNILSNAFKFTPTGGEVSIKLQYTDSGSNQSDPSKSPGHALIKVSDSGRGIPPDKLEKIFDRFYQLSDSDTRESEGTGIGLALTKELVDLYGGKLHVVSEVGSGSEFSILIPVSKQAFGEEEIIGEPPVSDLTYEQEDQNMDSPETVSPKTKVRDITEDIISSPVILIVEDNPDLRNYISGNLDDHFGIMMAENGEIGLAIARENIPDLIISDLMMPVMDGMEMCRHLKSDERTNHIPIIMLTAKADRGSKLKGLKTGADEYLVKPFDSEELQVRVRNLIQQRDLLREKFRKEFLTNIDASGAVSQNDILLNKILDTLKEHISESGFNMDRMSEELNMSRAQLFRKVNALTGCTPNDLLRNIRLKAAASLFKAGERNISQVMYQVGFNNQSYFAKCFRQLYKVNPSEYLKGQTGKAM